MESLVPIWIDDRRGEARVHALGANLVIDIPAELVACVEAEVPGLGVAHGYRLKLDRGDVVGFAEGTSRGWRMSVPVCPECGGRVHLHALSCSQKVPDVDRPPPLSEAVLLELRSLPPHQWYEAPADSYDQGLPVVEIRQDHLAALLAELESSR